MTATEPTGSFIRRLGGEPVVHFAVVALLLFGVAELADSRRREVVEIDRRELEWRLQQVERGRGAALDDEERTRAEQAYIDEQILAREAKARGLDDDARIRSILSQKMLHVLSGVAIQPTQTELGAYYEEHKARYARPPSVNADVFVVGDGRRDAGPPAGDRVAPVSVLAGVTRNDLAMAFGEAVAARLFQAEPGGWVGPYPVGLETRWFRVRERIGPGPPPQYEEVLGQLRYDWISEREQDLLEQRLAELRGGYSVRFAKDDLER